MHFKLRQIRSHELIRETDEYRLAQQAGKPNRLPDPCRPVHGDRLHGACWLGSAGEPSRCLRLSGTLTVDLSQSTVGTAGQNLAPPTVFWDRTCPFPVCLRFPAGSAL
jgi:hypothetical protein